MAVYGTSWAVLVWQYKMFWCTSMKVDCQLLSQCCGGGLK